MSGQMYQYVDGVMLRDYCATCDQPARATEQRDNFATQLSSAQSALAETMQDLRIIAQILHASETESAIDAAKRWMNQLRAARKAFARIIALRVSDLGSCKGCPPDYMCSECECRVAIAALDKEE